MGFPQVASITPTGFGSTSTHNVAMPASGVDAGALLLVLFAWDGTSATVSDPSGWTRLDDNPSASDTFGIWAKIADGSEDGTTVDFATSAAEQAAAQCYLITNWYGTIATGIDVGTPATGSASSINPPSTDPASWGTEDTLWIAVACAHDTDNITSAPTNFTDYTETNHTGTAGLGVQVVSARREQRNSSQNPGTFGGDTTVWCSFTIAVRPQTFTGTSSLTLPFPIMSGSGNMLTPASATSQLTLPFPVMTASGVTEFTGTSSLELPFPIVTSAGEAHVPPSGTSSLTLPFPVMTATGGHPHTGTAAFDLPFPVMSASGIISIDGTATLVLPFPIMTAEGTQRLFTVTSQMLLEFPTFTAIVEVK